MKIKEFERLYFRDRMKVLWKYGEFIARSHHLENMVCLYCVNDFFVEVFYSSENETINKIEPVKEKKILDNYLDDIKLVLAI